jgi:MOSC domain-containing protein YiiM
MDITLLSVQVGQPQTYQSAAAADGRPREWRTAFVKSAVRGPVWVGTLGLAGDGQADRASHGGTDKAVLAYAAVHYAHWQVELPGKDWQPGGFGENLTIAGVSEDDVCIGDLWQIGDVRLEVSQPRQPCWKLCRRWEQPDLVKRVVSTGRSGWYLRVVAEGTLTAGDLLTLLDRPHSEWTVTRVNRLFYGQDADPEAAAHLARLPVLSLSWREHLLNVRV